MLLILGSIHSFQFHMYTRIYELCTKKFQENRLFNLAKFILSTFLCISYGIIVVDEKKFFNQRNRIFVETVGESRLNI